MEILIFFLLCLPNSLENLPVSQYFCSWICFGGNVIKCCIQPKGQRGSRAEAAYSDSDSPIWATNRQSDPMCNQFCVHWELQVEETRKRLEYGGKLNEPHPLYAETMVWLQEYWDGFLYPDDKQQLRGKNGERITREEIILELNMCQSSHCYIHDRYIKCQLWLH